MKKINTKKKDFPRFPFWCHWQTEERATNAWTALRKFDFLP